MNKPEDPEDDLPGDPTIARFETVEGEDGPAVLMPGSPRAVARGCACPAERNNHGKGLKLPGLKGVTFIIQERCQLHSAAKMPPDPFLEDGGDE